MTPSTDTSTRTRQERYVPVPKTVCHAKAVPCEDTYRRSIRDLLVKDSMPKKPLSRPNTRKQVMAKMADGRWRTANDIALALGAKQKGQVISFHHLLRRMLTDGLVVVEYEKGCAIWRAARVAG